jgi:hypothetical protein
MAKMAGARGGEGGRGSGLCVQSGLEAGQLGLWKSMEKGLKEDNRLAQAGVQIIMDSVEGLPLALWVQGLAVGESCHGGVETAIQFIDEIGEGRDLVKELGFAGEQDLAEEVIEASDALALGILKILRGERGEIGSRTKMLGVFEHGAEQGVERKGESLTKGRGNREELVSLGVAATAAHAEGFIQTYTEHGVGYFKMVDGIQIGVRLIASEGKAPILRHRTSWNLGRVGTHDDLRGRQCGSITNFLYVNKGLFWQKPSLPK